MSNDILNLNSLNIKWFTIFETVGNILQTNHSDMAKIKGPGLRFTYPEYPESDSSYPQIVIKLDNVNYEEMSAGNYIGNEVIPNGYKEVYGRFARATLNIYTMTAKKTITKDAENKLRFTKNGQEFSLNDQKLNIYLANTTRDIILKSIQKGDFYKYGLSLNFKSEEPGYEDGKNKWTTKLSFSIRYIDYIFFEYQYGELLRQYSINQIIEVN